MNQHPLHNLRIHFMGAGGIGMSALALLAGEYGARVSGCDREASGNTARLKANNIPVTIGHDPRHAQGADILVHTSAIPDGHPEVAAAGAKSMRRGEFLAQLMRGKTAIGICGTHGKTTTSWLCSHILIHAGLDPTCVLGGVVRNLRGNLRVGQSDLFVAELDESDESFLIPDLDVAIITNIESEHLAHYRTFDRVLDAFGRFAEGVRGKGLLAACSDNAHARGILAAHTGRKISFGFGKDSDLRASHREFDHARQKFSLAWRRHDLGAFTLSLPGEHNLMNALAAVALSLELGVRPGIIRDALANCPGVQRRMELVQMLDETPVYSDYAHHPTEITCAIQAAREFVRGELLVIFQPHLYSRTRDYAREFGQALARADRVIVAEIYPAREPPIRGVSAKLVIDAIRAAGHNNVDGPFALDALPALVRGQTPAPGAIILMGAGSIGDLLLCEANQHENVDTISGK